MARARKKKYYDVVLTEAEIKRIKKGNTVHRWTDGIGIAVKVKDKKVSRQIAKLKAKLKELQKKEV